MVLDRNDKLINLVEIKYSNSEYIITKDYYNHLFERMSSFNYLRKTTKSVTTIFVSTYGVKQNEYSSFLQNNVTLDDLFFIVV